MMQLEGMILKSNSSQAKIGFVEVNRRIVFPEEIILTIRSTKWKNISRG